MLRDLVTDFNDRYDELNDALNLIVETNSVTGKHGDKSSSAYLNDYFNLCAEEYLFFKRGYVPYEVWESWRSGMHYFYHLSEAIADRWRQELEQESYYGFSEAILL